MAPHASDKRDSTTSTATVHSASFDSHNSTSTASTTLTSASASRRGSVSESKKMHISLTAPEGHTPVTHRAGSHSAQPGVVSPMLDANLVASKLSDLLPPSTPTPGLDEGHKLDPLLRRFDPSKDALPIDKLLARPRLSRANTSQLKAKIQQQDNLREVREAAKELEVKRLTDEKHKAELARLKAEMLKHQADVSAKLEAKRAAELAAKAGKAA